MATSASVSRSAACSASVAGGSAIAAARSGAANRHWDLLADRTRNALGDRVRFANLAALGDLDGPGEALGAALVDANGLGAALGNHLANLVVASLGAALGNHLASGVLADLRTRLADIAANGVVTGLGTALGNHLASGVLADLRTRFADVAANGVVTGLRSALGNHLASGVIASLGAALRNHLADRIVASLGTALGNLSANRVRDFTCATLFVVACAGDFLLLTGGNPDFLADRLGATLNAFGAARAGAIHASASRLVVSPSTGLTNRASHHRTRNGFRGCFPCSTIDRDGPGELLWNHNGVVLGANFLLLHGVVDRVVDRASLRFANRNHHGVVDGLAVSLVHRLVDGVVDRASLGLVHGLFDRVVDDLFVRLVNRLVDGVVDRTSLGLVHGLFDRVVDDPFVRLVNRLVDGVVDRTSFSLVSRDHHGVLDFALFRVRNGASRLNFFVFVVRFVPRTITSLLDLLVNGFGNVTHDGVAASGTSRCCSTLGDWHSRRSAVRDGAATDNCLSAIATTLVANRATISGARGLSPRGDRDDRQGRR